MTTYQNLIFPELNLFQSLKTETYINLVLNLQKFNVTDKDGILCVIIMS